MVNNLKRDRNSKGNKFIVRIIKVTKGQSKKISKGALNTAGTKAADLSGKETASAKRAGLQEGLATERSSGKMVGTGEGTSSNLYIDMNPELERPADGTPTSTLGHELKHSEDFSEGILNPNTMDPIGDDPGDKNGRGPKTSEYRAVLFENEVRKANGLPERKKYDERVIVPE